MLAEDKDSEVRERAELQRSRHCEFASHLLGGSCGGACVPATAETHQAWEPNLFIASLLFLLLENLTLRLRIVLSTPKSSQGPAF